MQSVRRWSSIPIVCSRRRRFQDVLRISHPKGWLASPTPEPAYLRGLAYSKDSTKEPAKAKVLQVKQLWASNGGGSDEISSTLWSSDNGDGREWKAVVANETKPDHASFYLQKKLKEIPQKAARLLLPANYPHSVSNGYLGFVSFCFTASIAGSASMVLSTQTLLLAVGIVGQGGSSTSVGIMAGALNWVMKDFMGQLGGIIFASKMGKTKAFDNDPKRWRMVAATALDGATLLEILSPLCYSSLVLPIASIANIGKNIGFLTASASRASLHQSLAVTGNLGDVTVKAGSQSMVASLAGTSLGIGLSTVLDHDILNFGICFVCLAVIHQGCTYLSLQNVSLTHFNRNRLRLAMDHYIHKQTVPSPLDVSKMEGFFPFISTDASKEWLRIGRSLTDVCQTPNDLETCLAYTPNEAYLVRIDRTTQIVDLIYFHSAEERDICRGLYHACLIRHYSKTRQRTDGEVTDEGLSNSTLEDPFQSIVRQAHEQVQRSFSDLFDDLEKDGWDTLSGLTNVEDENAHRIHIERL